MVVEDYGERNRQNALRHAQADADASEKKLADLQRQLCEAQEERSPLFRALRRTWQRFFEMKARAEAAEALVEKGQRLREELEEVGNYAVGIVWDSALLSEWDALKAPAEAQKEGDDA